VVQGGGQEGVVNQVGGGAGSWRRPAFGARMGMTNTRA
jgi:hypothetical protein